MNCPICKLETKPGDLHFPFCSERCKLIDLGNWSSEKYRIPAGRPPEKQEEEPDE
jgi:endogenous inhibitor of DNA gyrase (YacG/DUF329 family)